MSLCHLVSARLAKTAQIRSSETLSEVKLEARPLPWRDMNHWGEASSVLVQQQLCGEMSMLGCLCKSSL